MPGKHIELMTAQYAWHNLGCSLNFKKYFIDKDYISSYHSCFQIFNNTKQNSIQGLINTCGKKTSQKHKIFNYKLKL